MYLGKLVEIGTAEQIYNEPEGRVHEGALHRGAGARPAAAARAQGRARAAQARAHYGRCGSSDLTYLRLAIVRFGMAGDLHLRDWAWTVRSRTGVVVAAPRRGALRARGGSSRQAPRGCAVCEAFDAGLRATTEVVRTTPPELAPRRRSRFLPPSRGGVPLARVLAVAGVLVAAALGSIVGSTLDRPAPSSPKPAAQVSFLTRDLSQLRQIPRGKRVAPQVPAHQPGGPPEGVI